MFLIYGGGELILEGYSDASFQSDDDDAKSQSGFVFKLNGGVVSWKSSKQDTTANSTMEAEYIAASEAAKEAIWMKNYIQELGVVPSIAEPVVIFCDNNGAIAQAKELRSHHCFKHILRRYHLLREMVSRGDVRMDRVSSAENTADPLTKPMSQVAHTQHVDKHHNKAHGPTGMTVQQLDCALDDGHEINCLGLGLKRSKSRTSRMGIESPVETCTKSRIHWMSAIFHRRQTWTAYAILVDICGPLNTPARGGYSYFIIFTNDHSRYDYVYLIRYKSEAFERFKEYRLEVENQTGHKIKALRFDRGGEYLSDEFIHYLKQNGILSQWTPPRTPQLNRVTERRSRTLLDMNAVFLKKGFPVDSRWDEVLLEESREEPQHDNVATFEPSVPTDGVPVLHRLTRESRPPERYGFVGLTSQLDNNPKTYGEAMSNIDSEKWLEAMKSKMDSMGSNQVWTLVDPPKGVRPVGYKWF
ncbi:UNVERIFIED_CONTAM: Retrovirus-related Pol polyprotein from transposon RE2 [Sesamum latifolium]|uniref:Retrovirus-related Pol polyprotein from transposon RE2 n=1 Tax=Sesamum latifolium TaxID=2727402 RepID=A0AAW2X8W2_9LAMI